MSGYADMEQLGEGAPGPETPFLSKPFTPAELLVKTREVLDAPRP